MKAKSKVLLGLLMALAMMIFAVPAFAAEFSLDNLQAPEKAFQGKTYTVTVDVKGTTGNAPYDAKLSDVTTGVTHAIFADQERPNVLSSDSGTITVTGNVADNADEGIHNLYLTVTDKDGNTKGENFTVTVKKAMAAEITTPTVAAHKLEKTAVKGKPYGVQVVAANADAEKLTYTWQMATPGEVETTKAGEPDASGWTTVDGEKIATFNRRAAAEDEGKYLRCIVTDPDGQQVVASADDSGTAIYHVILHVNNKSEFTFQTPAEDETETILVTGTSKKATTGIEAAAKIGNTDITEPTAYQWKENGKAIEDTTVATGKNLLGKAFTEAAQKAGTYVYTCEVTDENTETSAVSPAYTLVVVEQPTVKIAEAVKDNTQVGNIYLTAEELENDQTFTADVTNPSEIEITNYEWKVGTTGNEATVAVGKDATSYTGKVADGQNVICIVTFKDLAYNAKYEYKAAVHGTAGQLSGGIYTSNKGGVNPTNDPTYTITLPAGLFFNDAIAAGDFKMDGTGAAETNKISVNAKGIGVTGVPTTAAAGDRTISFKLNPASVPDGIAPHVEDMVVVIDAGLTTDKEDGSAGTGKTVYLPVSSSVGYKITTAVTNAQLKVDPEEIPYTGKPVEVTVEGNVDGVGEVSNYRYDTNLKNSNPKAKTVSATAPTEVLYADDGSVAGYGMFVDVAAGDKYGAATDVRLKTDPTSTPGANPGDAPTVTAGTAAFKITPAVEKDIEAAPETYFTWTKEKDFTGEDQSADVKFADGITNAGEIKEVTYWQDDVQVTPNAPGDYTVKVSTKASDDDDYQNVRPLTNAEIGTFTIKKSVGEDLYTLKETEADYTGQAIVPEVVVKEGAGAVKATHYFKEGDKTQELTAIVQPGKYDVYIDSEEGTTYAAVTMEKVGTFTINNPAEVKPTYQFATHIQDIGWSKENKSVAPGTSETIGVTGQSKRLEAFALMVPENYTVEGFAHIQNLGDTAPRRLTSSSNYQIPEGFVAYEFGTQGRSLRIEAVNIGIKDPSGKLVDGFDYEAHVQNLSWLGAVRNGSFTGTRGQSLRLEAIKFDYAGTTAETQPAEETPATPETPAE